MKKSAISIANARYCPQTDHKIRGAIFLLRQICIFIAFAWLILAPYCHATEMKTQIDKMDKNAHSMQKAFKKSKFVVVPIPISNPTVGVGLSLAALYLHGQEKAQDTHTTTTGIAAMYTDNDSWIAGAFHDGYYFHDFMRFNVAGGYGELNLKYYGIGNDSIFRDHPLDFAAQASAIMPRLLFELPWEHFFLGLQYTHIGMDTKLDISEILPSVPEINMQTDISGVGFVGVYDTTDNNIWPSTGAWIELTVNIYDETFGGDYNYNKSIAKYSQYFKLADPYVLVFRIDGQFVNGKAPFWDLAQIKLRGFPYGRYLGDNSVTAQAEVRWNFYKNWTVNAFGGGGRLGDSFDEMGSSPTRWAGGAGIRYNIGGAHKLNIGIDITYAEDQVEVYFQIGDWLRN